MNEWLIQQGISNPLMGLVVGLLVGLLTAILLAWLVSRRSARALLKPKTAKWPVSTNDASPG